MEISTKVSKKARYQHVLGVTSYMNHDGNFHIFCQKSSVRRLLLHGFSACSAALLLCLVRFKMLLIRSDYVPAGQLKIKNLLEHSVHSDSSVEGSYFKAAFCLALRTLCKRAFPKVFLSCNSTYPLLPGKQQMPEGSGAAKNQTFYLNQNAKEALLLDY